MLKDIVRRSNKIKKARLYLSVSLISLTLFIIISPHLIFNRPLINGVDVLKQGMLYTESFERLLGIFFKTGELPFYDWNLFLGNNVFASKSCNGLTDVYLLLSYLMKSISFIDKNKILLGIKFIVSSLAMTLLLKSLKIKDRFALFGGLLYSLSSYFILFSEQQSFVSFYSFAPLLFVTIERYLQKNKKILFILTTAFLFINNFYYMISLSLFLPIYFTYRYFRINSSFKGFIKSTSILIFYFIVGVLLSSIVLVPAIIYLFENSRVGNSNIENFYSLRIYANILLSFLTPSYLFNSLWNYDLLYDLPYAIKQCFIFVGCSTVLFSIQFTFNKNKQIRNANIFLFIAIFAILGISFINSIMHGFSEPSFRWSYLIIMMIIILVCEFFSNELNVDIPLLKKTTVLYILSLIIGFTILMAYVNDFSITTNFYNYLLMGIICCLVILYFICMMKYNNNKKRVVLIIMVTTIVELTSFATFQFYKEIDFNEYGSYEFVYNATHILEDKENGFNNYLDSLDTGNMNQYYRINVDFEQVYWAMSLNMSLHYQINGLQTYDSTFAPSWNQMSELIGDENYYEISIEDANTLKF